ncbi:aromatic-amino-acid transaminase [Sphingobium sp. AP50]|uniref:amino acid aminotransferase n=1 Tax=Sphingobium sp. AP50 TaxID=1884369 RepID=UPI0008AAFC38|nr:amino acid aminotransferase [Sphingobium sp. AP50]SEJ15320.1 aromatic-amino-acid transaminase [Sphingobium sp. AP50]
MTLFTDTQDALFDALRPQAPDALLGLITAFRADPRPDKIDLGVGVFRDDHGATPVMRAVKAAEARLVADQQSKAYLGAEGDARYTELLAELLLGADAADEEHLAGVQTPGGTGALRLGAELIARARPDARVWIGTPTWPNHMPIFRAAGLAIQPHAFYHRDTGGIDFDAMMADLSDAMPGDIVLLHGCCHNPTGAGFGADQWRDIAALCERRGLIPFIDLAYQGLGDGLDDDAAATRTMLARLPEALIAYSCDKNFGLYRDRVGALWVQSRSGAGAAIAKGNMLAIARGLWSMPPDHGAAVVRVILDNPDLRADWMAELDAMRIRLNGLRMALSACHPRLAPIANQRGMFALLPLSSDQVIAAREQHGIYMAPDGRINIAGLTIDTITAFARGIVPYLNI